MIQSIERKPAARNIYHQVVSATRIGPSLSHAKNEWVNLTPAQKFVLRKIIEQWR